MIKSEEIDEKIDSIKKEIKGSEKFLNEIKKKKEDIEDVDSDMDNLIIEEISKELSKTLTQDDGISLLLTKEIDTLKKEIEKCNKPIKEREKKLGW